jgi:hypothetical protein
LSGRPRRKIIVFVSWLSSRPLWVLFVVVVTGLAAVVVGTRALGRRWLRGQEEDAAAVAGSLMPALGAAFAVMAAFGVAGAAADLRDAKADVAREASAAARLAWASSGHGSEGQQIQNDLLGYLRATTTGEWEGIDRLTPGDGSAYPSLQRVERGVRALVRDADLGSAAQSELLGALDDLGGARRLRFTVAEPVEVAMVALLLCSALALVINAGILGLRRTDRVAAVVMTLVVVTGLSIALMIAVGAPFSGAFPADTAPLDAVADDLQEGRFTLDP